MSQGQLNARASIAADLYKEGRVRRSEAFRLAVDAALGEDTGPIKFERNDDYTELCELGEIH